MKTLFILGLCLLPFTASAVPLEFRALPECEDLLRAFGRDVPRPELRARRVGAIENAVESFVYSSRRYNTAEATELKGLLNATLERLREHDTLMQENYAAMREEYGRYSIFAKVFGDGRLFRAVVMAPQKDELKALPPVRAQLEAARDMIAEVEMKNAQNPAVTRVQLALRYAKAREIYSSERITLVQGLVKYEGDLRQPIDEVARLMATDEVKRGVVVNFASFLLRSKTFTPENFAKLATLFKMFDENISTDLRALMAKALYLRGKSELTDVRQIETLFQGARRERGDLGSLDAAALAFVLTLKNAPGELDEGIAFYQYLERRFKSSSLLSSTGPLLYLQGGGREAAVERAMTKEREIYARNESGYVSKILTPVLLAMGGDARANLERALTLVKATRNDAEVGSTQAAAITAAILYSEMPVGENLIDANQALGHEIASEMSSSMADMSAAIAAISADAGSIGCDGGSHGGDGGASCH